MWWQEFPPAFTCRQEETPDGTIRVEEIPWIRKRYTRRFAVHVFRLTSITTNKEAGWFLKMDDEAVYRIDKGMPVL